MPPDSVFDLGLGAIGEPEPLEQRRRPRWPAPPASHPEVAAVEVEVLPDGEAAVERVRLRHDADQRLAAVGCASTSMPPTMALPLVGITRVVSIPTVVVLPAPFGPSRPKISPV